MQLGHDPRRSSAGRASTAQTGSAVPITSHTSPGSTTPAPRVAAISSPQPSTTWCRRSSPVASRSHGATRPEHGVGRAHRRERVAGSTPNASHASSDQLAGRARRAASVDDALDGSTASSPDACQRDERAGQQEPARGARCCSGSCARSHAILAATCPGSRLQPVQLAQALGVEPLGHALALRARAPIHPDQRRPDALAVGDRPARGRRAASRTRSRAMRGPPTARRTSASAWATAPEPLARVLLGPARARVRERVRHVAGRDVRAVGGDRLRARSLRADVDSDDEDPALIAPPRRRSRPAPVDGDLEGVGEMVLARDQD